MISSVAHSLLLYEPRCTISWFVIDTRLIPRGDGKVPGIHIRSKNCMMCKNRRQRVPTLATK